MSARSSAPPQGNLLFHWERPRRRRFAIAGFLGASLGLHALCFYLFQVIYPPSISLLPPPARVSVIAPTSEAARTFLRWLAAEDPALASQTQRPADARAFQLPKLAHVPSYIAVPPQLKNLEPAPAEHFAPAARPPGPVPMATSALPPPALAAPSTITFSGELRDRAVTLPALQFHSSTREAPQDARFRIAVDRAGAVRYRFLIESSSDAGLDEEAGKYLALGRFAAAPLPNDRLTWALATIHFGTDLNLPPAPAETQP